LFSYKTPSGFIPAGDFYLSKFTFPKNKNSVKVYKTSCDKSATDGGRNLIIYYYGV